MRVCDCDLLIKLLVAVALLALGANGSVLPNNRKWRVTNPSLSSTQAAAAVDLLPRYSEFAIENAKLIRLSNEAKEFKASEQQQQQIEDAVLMQSQIQRKLDDIRTELLSFIDRIQTENKHKQQQMQQRNCNLTHNDLVRSNSLNESISDIVKQQFQQFLNDKNSIFKLTENFERELIDLKECLIALKTNEIESNKENYLLTIVSAKEEINKNFEKYLEKKRKQHKQSQIQQIANELTTINSFDSELTEQEQIERISLKIITYFNETQNLKFSFKQKQQINQIISEFLRETILSFVVIENTEKELNKERLESEKDKLFINVFEKVESYLTQFVEKEIQENFNQTLVSLSSSYSKAEGFSLSLKNLIESVESDKETIDLLSKELLQLQEQLNRLETTEQNIAPSLVHQQQQQQQQHGGLLGWFRGLWAAATNAASIEDDNKLMDSKENAEVVVVDSIDSLLRAYPNQIVHCTLPHIDSSSDSTDSNSNSSSNSNSNNPQLSQQCDIFLIGSLHISNQSMALLTAAIATIRPHIVLLELCPNRVSLLLSCNQQQQQQQQQQTPLTATNPITTKRIWKSVWKAIAKFQVQELAVELYQYLQHRLASGYGSELGNEQVIAARLGLRYNATVVLGDRDCEVTMNRLFANMSWKEKLIGAISTLWELPQESLSSLLSFISSAESNRQHVDREIDQLRAQFPSVASVIVDERDEYMAQTIIDLARHALPRVSSSSTSSSSSSLSSSTAQRPAIIAVVGMGHLRGMERVLRSGGVTDQRMVQISSSSNSNSNTPAANQHSSWKGHSVFHVLRSDAFAKLFAKFD